MRSHQASPMHADRPPATSARVVRRAIAAAATGNAIEWYDYLIYAYSATTMGKVFFPGGSPTTQLLSAYGVFAISFLVRPFGGLILGPLGDRHGRQRVLALTILLMSGGTALIGILPSYATIGVASPALLVLLRLLQGFSTGGEYGGAATFMAEYAPDARRGFLGSFLEFGTLCGVIAGSGLVTLGQVALGSASFDAWGWRLPFLLALPLGLVGLYLRWRLDDTPVFSALGAEDKLERQTRTHVLELLRHWRPGLICMGLVLMLNITDYTLLIYMPEYLSGPLHLTPSTGLVMTLSVYVVLLAVINQAGRLSDRVGRKPVWYASAIGFLILSIPAFVLMSRGWVPAIIGFVVLGLLLVLQLGTTSATFPALFPTQIRYGGFAISYNISTSLFGGTAPLVNAFVIAKTHLNIWPALYMMAACAIGVIALVFAPETAGRSLRGRHVPGLRVAGPPRTSGQEPAA